MSIRVPHPLDEYLRVDRLPHIWCQGCGLGITINCLVTSLKELEVDPDEVVMVSGIGCTGRASGYTNTDAFHTTHGRAIPFATGVKVSNPKLKVIVISGDGDLFAIGGNHFIHAARRNVGVLVLCSNNHIYGMTGGQTSPTTPIGSRTTTSPYGNIEQPFNLVALAGASGAVFVSRWSVLHIRQLTNAIKKGLQKNGFAFIEVVSPCPVIFGRLSGVKNNIDMIKELRHICKVKKGIHPSEAHFIPGEEIIIGDFVDDEREEFSERVWALTRGGGRHG